MEKDIENLIEQLTKVRPEMLNEKALKLFNTIMAVLDERDKLKEENNKFRNGEIVTPKSEAVTRRKIFNDFKNHIPKSKVRKVLDEQYELFNSKNQKEYSQEVVDVLEELLEDE